MVQFGLIRLSHRIIVVIIKVTFNTSFMKRLILKGWIFVLLAIVGMGLNAQAPVITSLNPTNGTTGVAVNQVLSVTDRKSVV